ncbi:hypothetical protein Nepgr_018053 [Nepenthes gracilis]|uniref:PROP1-like PPR domain-containing protein n=1 Tax=Nepenthes gracilis TaxID=150966 RepID=A0AAD3XSQ8_NEPGR|nr:hypothetical protein Nepgr_018053 [Nepenthes gracilis]
MKLSHFFSKQTSNYLSRLQTRVIFAKFYVSLSATPTSSRFLLHDSRNFHIPPILILPINRVYFRYPPEVKFISISTDPKASSDVAEETDYAMNEFLSRFVYIMRGKLNEAYPDCDKPTIDGMLLIIVQKVVDEMEKGSLEHKISEASASPSQDFSEDLWKTVWEVSKTVCEDMEKETRKEKMKKFLQSEEVKVMTRFASEVGIRGDMLRELRFKWARQKMEESDFYENLERVRDKERAEEEGEVRSEASTNADEAGVPGKKLKVASLPKRHGKIKHKIYGLDLSDPKWAEVADKIHEAEEMVWPQEAKPITGKCRMVTERILSLKEDDDPYQLLAEWVELLQPSKVDWTNLLDKLTEQNIGSYYKVAEHVLSEPSFEANIHDFSKLIDMHAKENHMKDAERILKMMKENSMAPDILTLIALVHMYSKAGNLDLAKEAFETLRNQGFKPDLQVYNSMIMAYVNAGQPKLGESLMREMEARDIKPTKDIYMALLCSFARRGDAGGAQRIATTMQFSGLQQTIESCTLLVEAYGLAGDPDQARTNFDYMMKVGLKPDDRCSAVMIAAYEKKNLLDKALDLLLQLEKGGFEPGVATLAVLVDWLGKLQLVEEAEQILGKIVVQGESPPFKIQVSLCDMYSRCGVEKKALQSLGILEARKELLRQEDFERIINALIQGGFVHEAQRMHEAMEAQGYAASEPLKVSLMASQAFRGKTGKRPAMR